MRLLLLGASLLVAAAAVDRNELKALRPCFERYPNHKLIGMKSYHSEFRMQSEEECLHFCALTATRCRSIVYDSASHLCHFFLDDGAEQAEFAPRMIYFRVTAKRCLEDTLKKLPAETQALPTTTEEPKEKEFKSPVVARKRGGKLAKRKQIDSADYLPTTTTTTTTTTEAPPTLEDMGMKDAMDDLLDDIERNTEAFEIEQRKEKRARDAGERAELREIKEQIRKHLKEKIETLRENYPEMYEELMGREVEEEEEQEETTTTTTTTQRPINDGEIPFRRKKVARAPEKVPTTAQPNLVANDDEEEKSEDLGVLVPEEEPKPVEKKFLAIPDAKSEEIEYEDDALVRKPVSEIRKSPTRPVAKQDEKKTELKKNTFSKAELFAAQLSGGAVDVDLPEPTTPAPTTTTTRAARTTYTRRAVTRRIVTTTTTEAPEPIEIEHYTEAPQFSIKTRPVVDDETADSEAPPVTGCLDDEIPLWVRFENAEPDIDGPKGSAPVESREACQNACNEVDGARSITFSEKDNSCQCNVDFDGISMRKSAADDFSVSTSTRFCFANTLAVFHHCGAFMGFRDFTLNVSPRESFESLPPSYEGLQLCIELCSLSTDYACKSATFDFEQGKCELNDADSASNPSDFAPTMVDHILYFENSCERTETTMQKESVASTNVNRVAASDASKFTANPSGGGIGGLRVRPISRDTYTLKSSNTFRFRI